MAQKRKVPDGQSSFFASADSVVWEKFNAYLKFTGKDRSDVLPGLITAALKSYMGEQIVGEKR